MTGPPECGSHAGMSAVAWTFYSASPSHIRPVCQTCLADRELEIAGMVTSDPDTWSVPALVSQKKEVKK